MATLYEIDQKILETIDYETGEIIDPERLTALQMERTAKLQNVALWVKNLLSDAEAYKAEKDAFAAREKAAKNKAESLKKWLADALQGEKFTTAKTAVSFRKSESVEIQDEDRLIVWAMGNGHEDLLTFAAPSVNKTAIKQALKNGVETPWATIKENYNLQIK